MSNVIYVNVLGGPPFQYILQKLQAVCNVFIVQPEHMSETEQQQLLSLTANVCFSTDMRGYDSLTDFLIYYARKVQADAIITFDEFYLQEVSQANMALGFRGAGENAEQSIRKDKMYEVFKQYNLLKRNFFCSPDINELCSYEIQLPFIIKPSNCAGSLGIFPVEEDAEIAPLMNRIVEARESIWRVIDQMPFKSYLKAQPFIKEGLLKGNSEAWFGKNTPYADYLSVEGIIINKIYYPIAITSNYPTVYPFTETVSVTPTTLSWSKQLDIIGKIKPCLEAFGLEYCGVHTEIKLLDNHEIAIIESAARFAGWSIIPQIEAVFGIDTIGEYVKCLLDESYQWPYNFTDIYSNRKGCAATINLLPINESAIPWERVYYNREPDFREVISHESHYNFTPYAELGKAIEPFSPLNGAWNSFGKVFLRTQSLQLLNYDIYQIRKHLDKLIQ